MSNDTPAPAPSERCAKCGHTRFWAGVNGECRYVDSDGPCECGRSHDTLAPAPAPAPSGVLYAPGGLKTDATKPTPPMCVFCGVTLRGSGTVHYAGCALGMGEQPAPAPAPSGVPLGVWRDLGCEGPLSHTQVVEALEQIDDYTPQAVAIEMTDRALRAEVEREKQQTAMWLRERANEKARADAAEAQRDALREALREIKREAREMNPRKPFHKAALDSLQQIDRLVDEAIAAAAIKEASE